MSAGFEGVTSGVPVSRRSGPHIRVSTADLRRFAPAAAVVVVALGVYAVSARAHVWLCDDAFISFRYAHNLVDGHGLVFNRGERVEGYTNFLWVLELAALHALGVPFQTAAHTLSFAMTAATIALVCWLGLRTPLERRRHWVLALSLLLLLTERGFAVWSTSGLETRQLTFFSTLGIGLLSERPDSRGARIGASVAFALAILTRPEGPLIAGIVTLVFGALRLLRRAGLVRPVLEVGAVFTATFALHLLWRWSYYGELLPNTYYAKHVRAWWDMGFRYLVTFGVESGLYVIVPLVVVGTVARVRSGRPDLPAYALPVIVAHAVYVAEIGGDHFEFRPYDLWWPPLCLLAAEGIVCIGERIESARGKVTGGIVAALVMFVTLVHARALEWGQWRLARDLRHRDESRHIVIPVGDPRFAVLDAVPVVRTLLPAYSESMAELAKHAVALRHREHEVFWRLRFSQYGKYCRYDRGSLLPEDAVLALGNIGVLPFCLPSLTVVDALGLTDKTIARTPVKHPNEKRRMAHDRWAPRGYFEERGVNISIGQFATSARSALASSRYALELGPRAFLPFNSKEMEWVRKAFAGRPLWGAFLSGGPDDEVVVKGRSYRVGEVLGTFEKGLGGWVAEEGTAIPNPVQRRVRGQAVIVGLVGRRLLNSYARGAGDAATGSWISPPFVPRAGDALAFLVGGGSGSNVGVELLEGDQVLASWRGARKELLGLVFQRLKKWSGRELRLRVFDRSTAAWGHVIADHFVLVQAGP